jgi:peptide/nickel transport system substrate-binding protein
MAPLEKAEVIDKYTVRVHLKAQYIDYPTIIGFETKASIIAPESAGKGAKNPMGTGAFKLKEFIPGEKVILEKNPHYWKKGLPYLDGIEFVDIADRTTQVSALISGQVDALMSINVDHIDAFKKQKGIVVDECFSGTNQSIVCQLDKKPFNDPRVVYAIKLCLDREKFVELVVGGHGMPANDVNIGPSYPFYHDLPIRQQDYKWAKKLLTDAGYPDGLDIECYTSVMRPGMVESAVTLKDMCAPVGIRINVTVQESVTFFKETWRKASMFVTNWPPRPDIHAQLNLFYHQNSFDRENPGGPRDTYNTSHYINPTVSKLIDMGMSETDQQKREGMYKMAQAIIMETGGWITPYLNNYIRARSKKLQNMPLDPLQHVNMSDCWLSA